MHLKNSGMTLIEVLVASVILFSTLTVMTQVMSTSLKSAEQSEKNISIYLSTPLILDHIQSALYNGMTSEDNVFFNEVTFSWKATLKEIKGVKSVGINQSANAKRVFLYEVSANIKYKSNQKNLTYLEFKIEE